MRVSEAKNRTRMLLSGDAAVGKTYQMFAIIKWVLLNTEKQVFYMDCDTGAVRFVQRLMADPDLTDEQKERFVYFMTPDWVELRNGYREIRQLWMDEDVVMIDRVDMSWDFIQHYFNSGVLQLDEEELDDFYLTSRISKRVSSGDKKDMGPQNEVGGTDWDSVKSAYNSVVYDLYNGPGPTRKRINVVMSALAESKEHVYKPSGSKPDARVLEKFNVVVRGERNITSLPDTHLFLKRGPLGRVMSTVKDRERVEFDEVKLDSGGEFVTLYEKMVDEQLIPR